MSATTKAQEEARLDAHYKQMTKTHIKGWLEGQGVDLSPSHNALGKKPLFDMIRASPSLRANMLATRLRSDGGRGREPFAACLRLLSRHRHC
jgi:hypothetical protein